MAALNWDENEKTTDPKHGREPAGTSVHLQELEPAS